MYISYKTPLYNKKPLVLWTRGRYSHWDFSLVLLGCALQPNILSELSLISFSWLYEKSSYEDIWDISLIILYTIMRKINSIKLYKNFKIICSIVQNIRSKFFDTHIFLPLRYPTTNIFLRRKREDKENFCSLSFVIHVYMNLLIQNIHSFHFTISRNISKIIWRCRNFQKYKNMMYNHYEREW